MQKIHSRIIFLFISTCFVGSILWSCDNPKSSSNSLQENKKEIPIIFDTDIQGDYDDVGALAMLHAFADSGEINILATVASNLSPLTVPCIEVINTYFGRPNLPIGAPKTTGVTQNSRELEWPDSLVAKFQHKYNSNDDAPDAVEVYRKVLSQQADNSVTVVTVGFLTNLKNLLLSKPDSYSPLNGKDLVAKKVKHWVAMGGWFPEGKETNIKRDAAASEYAIDNWPTPIVFSGFEIGVELKTGLRLIKEGDVNSPIQMAYAMSIPKRAYDKDGRRSWDQSALLVAVRGFEPYYTYKTGQFITSPDGSNKWKDDPNGVHKHLVQKMSPDSVVTEIEDLMMHQPK